MIAEARHAVATNDDPSALERVEIEVEVTYNPTGDPTFKFYGLGPNHSVYVEAPEAVFVLTLSPIGFEGPVVFAAIHPEQDGPVSWFTPGSGAHCVRPSYIGPPELNFDSTTLAFTNTNRASGGKHDLIDFAVNIVVLLLGDDGESLYTSHKPYTSPDPTIINVDPTGPPPA